MSVVEAWGMWGEEGGPVKRDGEKQQAWLRREMIVYIKWKEVASFINDKQCTMLKAFGLELTHWFLHLRLEPSS